MIADVRVAVDGQPLLGPLAGIGHYTHQLIHALARVEPRHRYYVVAPRPLRRLSLRSLPLSNFSEPNVEVAVSPWWAVLRARLRHPLARTAVLKAVDPPVDVFHATNNVFPYPVPAARNVLTVHDLTLLRFPEWHPARRLAVMVPALGPAMRQADRIIAPSCSTRDDLVRLLSVDPERISIVPYGVAPNFTPGSAASVTARLEAFGLRPGEYVLFMGTIEPRKNLLRLLEAVEQAAPKIGPLVVAGGRGWNDDRILRTMARLESAGRVRSLGYVPDDARPALLGGARAFAFPSLYEGFGLPPLEAMACGTPVVTSNVASLPEVVGDAALCVDPTDVAALAAALTRVWSDDALHADLRARGLARAALFSWDRTARLTLDVYRTVLDRAPRSSSLHGVG
ncbi:MAG TPA: glycosyltransferase family 1 protein [Candidatus Acidoferrum sp.]|nr:glycosyltransferase family 1 protein [Candidatus Acidoferrum sp.]